MKSLKSTRSLLLVGIVLAAFVFGSVIWSRAGASSALAPPNFAARPASWIVTSTSDNPADTHSLRYAINNSANGDTINFNLAGCPCTIQLTMGSLVINHPLTIIGPGSSQLTISGGTANIDHGDGAGALPTPLRVFFIYLSSGEVNIQGLTVANGIAKGADGGCGGSGGGGAAGLGGGMFIFSRRDAPPRGTRCNSARHCLCR